MSRSRSHRGLIFIQERHFWRPRIPLPCSCMAAAPNGFLTLEDTLRLRIERGGLRLIQGQLPRVGKLRGSCRRVGGPRRLHERRMDRGELALQLLYLSRSKIRETVEKGRERARIIEKEPQWQRTEETPSKTDLNRQRVLQCPSWGDLQI